MQGGVGAAAVGLLASTCWAVWVTSMSGVRVQATKALVPKPDWVQGGVHAAAGGEFVVTCRALGFRVWLKIQDTKALAPNPA